MCILRSAGTSEKEVFTLPMYLRHSCFCTCPRIPDYADDRVTGSPTAWVWLKNVERVPELPPALTKPFHITGYGVYRDSAGVVLCNMQAIPGRGTISP